MSREYQKGFSRELHRDMEMLVFGRGGAPVIVFPTSMAPFFEWEDRGMAGALWPKIEGRELQLFCVHSVDTESWYNKRAHPRDRVLRHMQYDRYLTEELLPYIRSRNPAPQVIVTGCSFGGYHAVNFALRHPEVVSGCVSMGGAFDIKQFLDGYYDENCYFNNPPDFLTNMTDDWYLSRYRAMRIVLATGEWDMCMDQNVRMARILESKAIPHWLDIWGDHTGHDWPFWQRMLAKYF